MRLRLCSKAKNESERPWRRVFYQVDYLTRGAWAKTALLAIKGEFFSWVWVGMVRENKSCGVVFHVIYLLN